MDIAPRGIPNRRERKRAKPGHAGVQGHTGGEGRACALHPGIPQKGEKEEGRGREEGNKTWVLSAYSWHSTCSRTTPSRQVLIHVWHKPKPFTLAASYSVPGQGEGDKPCSARPRRALVGFTPGSHDGETHLGKCLTK